MAAGTNPCSAGTNNTRVDVTAADSRADSSHLCPIGRTAAHKDLA
jgi:hypothetical protein